MGDAAGFGIAKFNTPLGGVAIILSLASVKKLDICCLLNVEFRGPLSCWTAVKTKLPSITTPAVGPIIALIKTF